MKNKRSERRHNYMKIIKKTIIIIEIIILLIMSLLNTVSISKMQVYQDMN